MRNKFSWPLFDSHILTHTYGSHFVSETVHFGIPFDLDKKKWMMMAFNDDDGVWNDAELLGGCCTSEYDINIQWNSLYLFSIQCTAHHRAPFNDFSFNVSFCYRILVRFQCISLWPAIVIDLSISDNHVMWHCNMHHIKSHCHNKLDTWSQTFAFFPSAVSCNQIRSNNGAREKDKCLLIWLKSDKSLFCIRFYWVDRFCLLFSTFCIPESKKQQHHQQ